MTGVQVGQLLPLGAVRWGEPSQPQLCIRVAPTGMPCQRAEGSGVDLASEPWAPSGRVQLAPRPVQCATFHGAVPRGECRFSNDINGVRRWHGPCYSLVQPSGEPGAIPGHMAKSQPVSPDQGTGPYLATRPGAETSLAPLRRDIAGRAVLSPGVCGRRKPSAG